MADSDRPVSVKLALSAAWREALNCIGDSSHPDKVKRVADVLEQFGNSEQASKHLVQQAGGADPFAKIVVEWLVKRGGEEMDGSGGGGGGELGIQRLRSSAVHDEFKDRQAMAARMLAIAAFNNPKVVTAIFQPRLSREVGIRDVRLTLANHLVSLVQMDCCRVHALNAISAICMHDTAFARDVIEVNHAAVIRQVAYLALSEQSREMQLCGCRTLCILDEKSPGFGTEVSKYKEELRGVLVGVLAAASEVSEQQQQQEHSEEWRKWVAKAVMCLPEPEDENVKRARMRDNVLRELLTTEETHCRSVGILHDHFIHPAAGLLPHAGDDKDFFASFQVIKMMHERVLEMLRHAMGNPNPAVAVGKGFCKIIPFFVQVKPYVENYHRIKQWRDERPNFAAVVQAKEAEFHCKLNDLAICEPQRVIRYRLLLESLLGYLHQGDEDFVAVEAAKNKLLKVLSDLNKQQQQDEKIVRVLEISSTLPEAPGVESLVQPHRRFVQQGRFTDSSDAPLLLFLFNDLLVVAYVSTSKFRFTTAAYTNIERLSLQMTEAASSDEILLVSERERLEGGVETSRVRWQLKCESPANAQAWEEAIQNAVDAMMFTSNSRLTMMQRGVFIP